MDANGNGLQEDYEKGVKGVKVELYSGSGRLVAATTSNADGHYTFSFPGAGQYFIRFSPPPNYRFTLLDVGEVDNIDSDVDPRDGNTNDFILASGETNHDLDAGLVLLNGDDPPTKTPTPTPSPTPTSTPSPTPFMGGESTHTLRGAFSEGTGGCGYATSFDDELIVTIEGSTITFRQPSTGDVNTGTINPDGTFKVERADGKESYEGKFNAGWSGEATNKYTDANGCTMTYKVVFTPK